MCSISAGMGGCTIQCLRMACDANGTDWPGCCCKPPVLLACCWMPFVTCIGWACITCACCIHVASHAACRPSRWLTCHDELASERSHNCGGVALNQVSMAQLAFLHRPEQKAVQAVWNSIRWLAGSGNHQCSRMHSIPQPGAAWSGSHERTATVLSNLYVDRTLMMMCSRCSSIPRCAPRSRGVRPCHRPRSALRKRQQR